MTEYADKGAFQNAARGVRRFRTLTLPLVGTVRIRSINALEYAGIEAAITRAVHASKSGRADKQQKALADAYADLMIACVVDNDGTPVFTADDKPTLLSLDSSVSQSLTSACLEHCGIDGCDLEELAKNSATTASSPTG